MESEEDADMDGLLFATFSALESGGGGSEELESGEAESETGGDDDDDEEDDVVAEVERVDEEGMDRVKEVLDPLQALKGGVVSEGKEAVQRRYGVRSV